MNRNANDADSREQPEVGGQRDHRAGAGGDAVDGGDHGHRQLAQRLDDRAGHPRELAQLGGLALDQLADDLLDVAAGAEAAALAGDHQHPRVAAVGQLGEQVAQVRVGLERQRVELVGSVQRDRGDAVAHIEIEVPAHEARRYST